MKVCPTCGAQCNDSSAFCINCGAQFSASQSQQQYSQPQQQYVQAQPQQYSQPQQQYAAPQPTYSSPANETVSIGNWIGTFILTGLPLVGLILLFVWAFGSNTPKSKSNYAKATLIMMVIAIVLSIIVGVIMAIVGVSIFDELGGGYYW